MSDQRTIGEGNIPITTGQLLLSILRMLLLRDLRWKSPVVINGGYQRTYTANNCCFYGTQDGTELAIEGNLDHPI